MRCPSDSSLECVLRKGIFMIYAVSMPINSSVFSGKYFPGKAQEPTRIVAFGSIVAKREDNSSV
jgi:hypothetical protein